MNVAERLRCAPGVTGHEWCAICWGPGSGGIETQYLTHGVTVRLCAAHRTLQFQQSGAGRAMIDHLASAWRAGGTQTRRRWRALADHERRIRSAPATGDLPGSYTWPYLRDEVETRFAAGEDPRVVIADVRSRSIVVAMLPSYRTLRRWFAEGRWFGRSSPPHDCATPTHPHADGISRWRTGGEPDCASRSRPGRAGIAEPIRGPC